MKTNKTVDFKSFMLRQIELKSSFGKLRTAEAYASSLKSLSNYHPGPLPLKSFDQDLMTGYEEYLCQRGICLNSSSFYMRNLRAVYNAAVDQGLTEQRSPFRKVYTGIAKTSKRALGVKEIKRISLLDLSFDKSLEFARDIFLFSFYTRGMSFVDIAYLKHSNLSGVYIKYRRRKTGQALCVKGEPCIFKIISKYRDKSSAYVFPIIRNDSEDFRLQYRRAGMAINRKLKTIAKMARIDTPLTMYVARHSWASIARNENVPLMVISEGMGHDSERTTMIYLASLDAGRIDRANHKILSLVINLS